MSQEELEHDSTDAGSIPAAVAGGAEPKMVPVVESIKYRRRAQQAEEKLQEVQQQLQDVQSRIEQQTEDLGRAEAQRDEARQQITQLHNRMLAQRLMGQAGVVDIDAACVLLQGKINLGDELNEELLVRGVEELLLDKPFLRQHKSPSMPRATASARISAAAPAAQLAQAADQAAKSGGRRDIANYLRLRRQASTCATGARR